MLAFPSGAAAASGGELAQRWPLAGRGPSRRRERPQTRTVGVGPPVRSPSSGGRYSLCTFRKRYAVGYGDPNHETHSRQAARGRRFPARPGLRARPGPCPDAAGIAGIVGGTRPAPVRPAAGAAAGDPARRRADLRRAHRGEGGQRRGGGHRQERHPGPRARRRRLPPEGRRQGGADRVLQRSARRRRRRPRPLRGADRGRPAEPGAGQPGGDLLPGPRRRLLLARPAAGRGSAFAQRRHRAPPARGPDGDRRLRWPQARHAGELDRRPGGPRPRPGPGHDTAGARPRPPGRAAQLRHRAPAAAAAPPAADPAEPPRQPAGRRGALLRRAPGCPGPEVGRRRHLHPAQLRLAARSQGDAAPRRRLALLARLLRRQRRQPAGPRPRRAGRRGPAAAARRRRQPARLHRLPGGRTGARRDDRRRRAGGAAARRQLSRPPAGDLRHARLRGPGDRRAAAARRPAPGGPGERGGGHPRLLLAGLQPGPQGGRPAPQRPGRGPAGGAQGAFALRLRRPVEGWRVGDDGRERHALRQPRGQRVAALRAGGCRPLRAAGDRGAAQGRPAGQRHGGGADRGQVPGRVGAPGGRPGRERQPLGHPDAADQARLRDRAGAGQVRPLRPEAQAAADPPAPGHRPFRPHRRQDPDRRDGRQSAQMRGAEPGRVRTREGRQAWRFAAGLPVSLFLTLGPALARTPPPDVPSFGERIEVRVVNVEVVVTDKGGNRVPGLAAADFRLKVDGQEVPIEFFSEVRGGGAVVPGLAAGPIVAGLPSLAPGNPVGTSYLVFIDDFFSAPQRRDEVLRSLAGDLGRLQPEDRMAIVAFDGRKLALLASWTGDPAALGRALAQARARRAHGLDRMAELNTSDIGRQLTPLVPLQLIQPSAVSSRLDPEARMYAERLADQVQKSVAAAVSTLRSFASPPGRKVMLLLDGGWPFSPASYVVNDNRPVFDRDVPGGEALLRPLADAANLLGYTLYPVDVPGLDATFADASVGGPPPVVSFPVRQQEIAATLDYVARETGGRPLHAGLRRAALEIAAGDTRSYYWLGFSPARQGDDRHHAIEVEVRRAGLAVRSRTGYVDLSRRGEGAMQVESALFFGTPSGAESLPVELGAAVRSGWREIEVPVSIALPIQAMAVVPVEGRWRADLELRVAALDENGDRSDVPAVPIQLTFDTAPERGRYVPYNLKLKLRRIRQHLVLALFDSIGGKILTAEADVDPHK